LLKEEHFEVLVLCLSFGNRQEKQVRSIFQRLFLVLLASCCGCRFADQSKPDIFLIIIDTLRADHMSCYGYERQTTPNLDSLAASGTLFSRCQAQSPWTLPSSASIWTGLSTRSHQAGMRNLVNYGLDSNLESIATLLKDEGYVTLGFVNVMFLGHPFGFNNGFDHYSVTDQGHGRAALTIDEALAWFSDNQGNPNPKFTVIHLYDVHSPYNPPEPFDRQFSPDGTGGVTEWEDSLGTILNPEALKHLINMYDGEIAWVDSELGRFFGELRRNGIAENAYIIVVSDHGEEFLEHGRGFHGFALYQEQLHVPLIVAGPGIPAGAVDSTLCGQFDILPVIAGFIGASVPEYVEGIDLFHETRPQRVIPSSGTMPRHSSFTDPREIEFLCSVLSDSTKGIMNFYTQEEQLYNLSLDPTENDPGLLDSLIRVELENYWATPPVGNPLPVEGDVLDDNLEDLGYI